MSHHTTHRRNLASSDPKTSMDPTPQNHPPASPYINTTTTTTSTAKPHPDPPSSTTIQHISNHFSKLYTNHKSLASLKPSNGYPHHSVDTHLQAKAMSVPTISHSSATSLTKSYSQRRPNMAEMGKDSTRGVRVVKVKEKVKKSVKEYDEGQEIKREIVSSSKPDVAKKERAIQESFDGLEIIKKPYFLMPTNLESDVKELQEMKRQSFSSRAGGGGRRRSFCSSQAELANFMSCNGVKVVSVDMPPFMQIHAVDYARKTHDSLEKFTAKTLALTLKKEFDGVYGPAWHCIVGTSFGSFVTHSVGGFLYFSMDQKHYVLLFKTTVQKAS